ncbi:hypothetical protein A3C96_00130 [Candidatus Uhrbacteria bacterium RIFCSPHIGHO2_02_FULL_60_10]|uniref:Transcription elongation factor GreA n=1 Tax=Candidatus Uhrbacteria bacterium RIFCSPHIGHO2_02_FULL_60_10 TaxID=1802392 RepID=A0A1F7U6U3_9BACT|nr:MAG: hypothetical protein A3C96_00130 [Candidatus Uhrbacteria bacterium RIFCSPHIGHO2_02_FULL_60_10]
MSGLQDKPFYVSAEGLEKMKEELKFLKTEKRRELTERIEKAKELGDLRENADYQEAKEELSMVEGRILEIESSQKRAVVIEKRQSDMVALGSVVTVVVNGREKIFSVVGSHEANPLEGRISNESPLGKVLLGKKVGDTAEVQAPSGSVRYEIKAVK